MANGTSHGFLISRNCGPECRGSFAASHFVRVHLIASHCGYVTGVSTNSHLSAEGWPLPLADRPGGLGTAAAFVRRCADFLASHSEVPLHFEVRATPCSTP